MSNGYEISFNKSPGQTILSGDFNNEFTALDTAFHETNGHTHDGTPGEGGPIATVQSSNGYNKVNIDAGNNEIEFHVNVSSAAVEQVKIKDGVIEPTTDNDIDLGSATKEFKDLYIDGIAYIDTAQITAATITTTDINSGTIDNCTVGATTPSTGVFTTLTAGTVDINGGNIDATDIGLFTPAGGTFTSLDVTTSLLPTVDNTVDLGSATYEFKDLYVDGVAYIDSISGGEINSTVIGNKTPSTAVFTGLVSPEISVSTLATLPKATFSTTSITISEDVLPSSSDAYDIGDSTHQMKDIYASKFLNIVGASENSIDFSTDDTLILNTADTERMRINSSGNVGIGTTNPGTYKLYVNGSEYVNGNFQVKWVAKGPAYNGLDATAGEHSILVGTFSPFTFNLPANPALGDTVTFKIWDADANNITIGANGNKIYGSVSDVVYSDPYTEVTFVYYDTNSGWI